MKNPKLKEIKEQLLDRVWREHKLSTQFRKHCQFIAKIYPSLVSLMKKTESILNFRTQTDLYGMKYLILPLHDTFFSISENYGKKKYYFLDIFDELPPRLELKKRIKQYFKYFDNGYWQDHTKVKFPNIILVSLDVRSKNYLFRKIEENPGINFFLSTWDQIKTSGITREVLQRVE